MGGLGLVERVKAHKRQSQERKNDLVLQSIKRLSEQSNKICTKSIQNKKSLTPSHSTTRRSEKESGCPERIGRSLTAVAKPNLIKRISSSDQVRLRKSASISRKEKEIQRSIQQISDNCSTVINVEPEAELDSEKTDSQKIRKKSSSSSLRGSSAKNSTKRSSTTEDKLSSKRTSSSKKSNQDVVTHVSNFKSKGIVTEGSSFDVFYEEFLHLYESSKTSVKENKKIQRKVRDTVGIFITDKTYKNIICDVIMKGIVMLLVMVNLIRYVGEHAFDLSSIYGPRVWKYVEDSMGDLVSSFSSQTKSKQKRSVRNNSIKKSSERLSKRRSSEKHKIIRTSILKK